MRGTIVRGVTDGEEGRGALAVAAELSERLRLRLVLVHVADGIALAPVPVLIAPPGARRAGKAAS